MPFRDVKANVSATRVCNEMHAPRAEPLDETCYVLGMLLDGEIIALAVPLLRIEMAQAM